MIRLGNCIAGKLYAIRKQYPVIKEFGCRVKEVEKELNRNHTTKNSVCDHPKKPICGNVCKNRQKR